MFLKIPFLLFITAISVFAINPDSLKKITCELASDKMLGRGTGQKGEVLAAEYIAARFSEHGLIKPAGLTAYYQYVPLHGSTPKESSQLKLFRGDGTFRLNIRKDYVPVSYGDPTFIPDTIEIVFAGYGISAPEYDYDDYHFLDVENKVVVVLGGEPLSDNETFFDGRNLTHYSLIENKRKTALARGATGLIFIPNLADFEVFNWEKMSDLYSSEYVRLASEVSSSFSIILNPVNSHLIFSGSDYSYETILSLHKNGNMTSFPLKTSLSFKGKFEERDFLGINVIGMLEGSDDDLKDEYVLVTAHYDHLGYDSINNGVKIFNGTLDNAIGVAGMLEIIRDLSVSRLNKRSIIFAAVTAEEKGLLGSVYYTQNPPYLLYKTVANVNIDGLCFIDTLKSLIGIGADKSELNEIFTRFLKDNELKPGILPDYFENTEAFARSDQYAFARAGIPSALLYEGLDFKNVSPEKALNIITDYMINRYHTSLDICDETINFSAAAFHAALIKDFLLRVAEYDGEIKWLPGNYYEIARLRNKAEKR